MTFRDRLPGGRFVLVAVFLAASLALLVLGRAEIQSVLSDLRSERWQEKCEATGNPEACGRYAIRAVRDTKSFDEMRRGLELFDNLCAQDIPRGCRFGGWLRSDVHDEWLLGENAWLTKERRRRATESCLAGDPRGCVVTKFVAGMVWQAEEAADKMCDEGDMLACAAATGDEQGTKACESGFLPSCEFWDPSPTACTDGDWPLCDGGSHTGVEREVFEALRALGGTQPGANRLETNPGLYRISLSVDGLGAACKDGSGVACFAMGMNATADMNPFEHGPVATRSLDITWGKACDLGVNAACYAYAVRLLDRPFKEPNRDEKRADKLLSLACERGHAASCWLQAMELLELPAEIERYRDAARGACRESFGIVSPECEAWGEVLALDINAAPWLRSNAQAYRHMREACRNGNGHRSCDAAAELVIIYSNGDRGIAVPPLWVQATSIAEFSCRGSWVWSCGTLFHAAFRWKDYGMTPEEELRREICPLLPDGCGALE